MVGLEHQGRPQPDGSLPTASTVNSQRSQPGQDLVSPRSTVTVDSTECSSPPGVPQVLRILRLQLHQASHQDLSSLEQTVEDIQI